jgi:hypothetical protein
MPKPAAYELQISLVRFARPFAEEAGDTAP